MKGKEFQVNMHGSNVGVGVGNAYMELISAGFRMCVKLSRDTDGASCLRGERLDKGDWQNHPK